MTRKVGQHKEKKTRKRGLSLVDSNPKMFREPNYKNAFTLNIL